MDFHGFFRDAEVGCDLLVEHTGNHTKRYIPLPWRQGCGKRARQLPSGLLLDHSFLPGDGRTHRAYQELLVHGLGQKIQCTLFHRTHSSRHIAVGTQE